MPRDKLAVEKEALSIHGEGGEDGVVDGDKISVFRVLALRENRLLSRMTQKKHLGEQKCCQKRTVFLLGLAAALLFWIGAIIVVPRRALSGDFAGHLSGSFDRESHDNVSNSFFFVETSGRSSLNGRQACAAESAARHHPNNIVNFLMTGEPDLTSAYIGVLRNISNVRVLHVDPKDIFVGTPLESWYRSPARLQSPYAVAHLSDALRLALLWRFGGFYLDTDVVVQRPMLDLGNALGRESDQALANGVLVFDRGHPILLDAMERFAKRYSPGEWATNGPQLLQTVIRERCSKCLRAKADDPCGCDLHVLPSAAFYAIHYSHWKAMLDPSTSADVLPKTRESYLLHFWNFLSSKTAVGKGSLYDIVAKKNCANVYMVAQSVGDF